MLAFLPVKYLYIYGVPHREGACAHVSSAEGGGAGVAAAERRMGRLRRGRKSQWLSLPNLPCKNQTVYIYVYDLAYRERCVYMDTYHDWAGH
jgi:hypothetical protein